jgi:hypothetical protein
MGLSQGARLTSSGEMKPEEKEVVPWKITALANLKRL